MLCGDACSLTSPTLRRDAKWALLNGDGESIWGPDPELTPIGEDQARSVNREWQRQLHLSSQSKDHAPLPTKLFSSPLKRSSRTLQLSYEGLLLPPGTIPPGGEGKAVGAPYVKEDLREQYGNDNTCINRSTKSEIQRNFPHFEIEQGFTEEDERFKVSLTEGREVAKVLGRSSIEAPYITDGLRENYRDVHTCDERSTRSVVKGYNPGWTIEPGFTEEDGAFGVSPCREAAMKLPTTQVTVEQLVLSRDPVFGCGATSEPSCC